MKKALTTVLLAVFVLGPSTVIAADIEDAFLRGIFQYLAERRNMNLVVELHADLIRLLQ